MELSVPYIPQASIPSPSAWDYRLAFHCAPTIAGIKPASLISVRLSAWPAMRLYLARSGRSFKAQGIRFYRLAQRSGHVLLLVYRRALLEEHLARRENRELLEEQGYAPWKSLGDCLARLAERIGECGGCPHDIGVFLGYPPGDVRGFIKHRGRNYQLCGYWKVYQNPSAAKQIFSAYDAVRAHYCAQVCGGEKIQHITYGGIAQ